MKIKLHYALLLAISFTGFAQTGIGTTTPQASAILDLTATDKALLLSRVSSTDAIADPEDGMIVYDQSGQCIKIYAGGSWSGCLTYSSGTITALDCSTALNTGSLKEGSPAENVASVISYTGGNGKAHNGQSVSSTGVPGLTATLGAGSFINGDATLHYTITGTPLSYGTASFALSIGNRTCTLTHLVKPAVGSVASLDCAGVAITGVPEENTAASGTSFTLAYTGGNGGDYAAQNIASTGVTGLTAHIDEGTFATGAGTLTYTITGTPTGSGTASFSITAGGQTCTIPVTVSPAPIAMPIAITLAQNQSLRISSIYDTDYQPYALATGPASTAVAAADGTADPTVDIQGTITTTGTTITIAAIATDAGTLPAYTSAAITIPAGLTQDGVSRDVVLSWESQAFTTATTSITATIKAIGGTLNIKKLDVNAGIGNDALGVVMGSLVYPYNNGATTSFTLRAISGIPDKMYNVADNTGDANSHKFIYLPVPTADGKVWLNNNLGANYANLNSPVFNPTVQASGAKDYNAYGSLFQWGRKPDGHELINWIDGNSGTGVNPAVMDYQDNPTHGSFIYDTSAWRPTLDTTLWVAEAAANNPCPGGFRVPTAAEMQASFSAEGITNLPTAVSSTLKFTATSHRSHFTGTVTSGAGTGLYWTTTNISGSTQKMIIHPGIVYSNDNDTAMGLNVRCIKD